MDELRYRAAALADLEPLARLRAALWPEAEPSQLREEADAILRGHPPGALPLTAFVAEAAGRLVGFVEVGLRSHADGCDPARPVGFLEGWYVAPAFRRRGVGRRLVECAEAWAAARGCAELASDTWLDHQASELAHAALGFEVADRCVHFRKALPPAPAAPPGAPVPYGAELARVHHEHFGQVARGAARELLARLAAGGVTAGTVVDLAAGSGLLARELLAAGFAVHAVELSPHMLRLARAEAPGAALVEGSLWAAALPAAVAVAAVGEAFSYAADPAAGEAALAARLEAIHEALLPGGLLLFDVAGPGRSGTGGRRRAAWSLGELLLALEEREEGARLRRAITLFVPEGALHRRVQEEHELHLYAPEAVERLLERAGFAVERLAGYGDLRFAAGWHGWACQKARRPGAPLSAPAGSR